MTERSDDDFRIGVCFKGIVFPEQCFLYFLVVVDLADTVCEDTCHPAADKAGEPERDDYLWRNPDGQAELSGICEGTGSTVAEQAV